MLPYLNFHTHQATSHPEECDIYNVMDGDITESEFKEARIKADLSPTLNPSPRWGGTFYTPLHLGEGKGVRPKLPNLRMPASRWLSVGVHPWFIKLSEIEQQLAQIEKAAQHSQVVAIGECGLDKRQGLPLAQQWPIFEAQVQLAHRLQKPIIVHCVKAFNELIHWKKHQVIEVPMVVHGFNQKPESAEQLIQHGFYISLGAALLRPHSNAQNCLKIIPSNRLLLENDAQLVPIKDVYEAAAQVLGIYVDDLKNCIWDNFSRLTDLTPH